LFAYHYWKDKGREFQTMPMDIPRQRQFPEVPVTETTTITTEDHYDQLGNFIGRY
jgi:hypothetical protein